MREILCEDDGEEKDTNRKEDFLPRKSEGVLLCWAALSFHFQSTTDFGTFVLSPPI